MVEYVQLMILRGKQRLYIRNACIRRLHSRRLQWSFETIIWKNSGKKNGKMV